MDMHVRRAERRVLWVVMLWALLASAGCVGAIESSDAVAEAPSPEEALALAKATLESSPDDPYANLVLARHYIEVKQYRGAELHAQKAFDSGRLNAQAGRTLGKVMWELGRPIEAVDAWRVARAADPTVVGWPDYLFAMRQAITTATTFRDYETSLRLRLELRELLEADPSRWPKATEARESVRWVVSEEAIEQIRVELKQALEEEKKASVKPVK